MAELKEGQLIFVDENQNEVLCDILFTYDSEEFGKSYVFFSPVTDEESREVAVASFIPSEDGIGELQAVESDEEWEMLEEVFESYASEECECGCGCECDDECDCEEEHHHEGCCCHHHHNDENK